MTATGNPALQAILDAPLPPVLQTDLWKQPRKTWSAEIRALFKDMGLKGIKVTTPHYSMASSIDIELPPVAEHEMRWMEGHEWRECEHCQGRQQAMVKIEKIVRAAFPDLRSRPEYNTDSVYPLTVL